MSNRKRGGIADFDDLDGLDELAEELEGIEIDDEDLDLEIDAGDDLLLEEDKPRVVVEEEEADEPKPKRSSKGRRKAAKESSKPKEGTTVKETTKQAATPSFTGREVLLAVVKSRKEALAEAGQDEAVIEVSYIEKLIQNLL